ncbi:Taxane 13-alpha-hydroxylase [Bienertia sinuspersici]
MTKRCHQGRWGFLGLVKPWSSTKPYKRTRCSRIHSSKDPKAWQHLQDEANGVPYNVVNGAEADRFFLSNEFKLVVSSWPSSSVQLMGKDSIMEKTGEQHRVIRSILSPCLGNAGLEGFGSKELWCHQRSFGQELGY